MFPEMHLENSDPLNYGSAAAWAGLPCIHGYSVEYPKFLTKKLMYIVYNMLCIKRNRKKQLNTGFAK
jgi:hypothetical protein